MSTNTERNNEKSQHNTPLERENVLLKANLCQFITVYCIFAAKLTLNENMHLNIFFSKKKSHGQIKLL